MMWARSSGSKLSCCGDDVLAASPLRGEIAVQGEGLHGVVDGEFPAVLLLVVEGSGDDRSAELSLIDEIVGLLVEAIDAGGEAPSELLGIRASFEDLWRRATGLCSPSACRDRARRQGQRGCQPRVGRLPERRQLGSPTLMAVADVSQDEYFFRPKDGGDQVACDGNCSLEFHQEVSPGHQVFGPSRKI